MFKKFWNDESGVIISAELVLVLTIAVLAMVVGLSEVAVAINTELNDLSNAFGAIDQSYQFTGFNVAIENGAAKKVKASSGSARYVDGTDDCDCNSSCDIVVGINQRYRCLIDTFADLSSQDWPVPVWFHSGAGVFPALGKHCGLSTGRRWLWLQCRSSRCGSTAKGRLA